MLWFLSTQAVQMILQPLSSSAEQSFMYAYWYVIYHQSIHIAS